MLLLIYSLFSSVSRHVYGFLDSYNCPCRTFATGNAWWAKGPFRKAGSSIEQVVWAWVKIVDRQNRWFKFDTKSDQPFLFHCYPHYLSVAGPNCRSSWSKKAAYFWSLLLEDNLKKVDMWRSRISDYRIGRRGIFLKKMRLLWLSLGIGILYKSHGHHPSTTHDIMATWKIWVPKWHTKCGQAPWGEALRP